MDMMNVAILLSYVHFQHSVRAGKLFINSLP